MRAAIAEVRRLRAAEKAGSAAASEAVGEVKHEKESEHATTNTEQPSS
jgi:hypothetical protein